MLKLLKEVFRKETIKEIIGKEVNYFVAGIIAIVAGVGLFALAFVVVAWYLESHP